MTLLSLAVPLTGLLLHQDHLRGQKWRGLSVARLWVLPHLPVKDGQLFVELAPGFHELVKSRPSLGVRGTVILRWLRV
jgi:hypothetical protein